MDENLLDLSTAVHNLGHNNERTCSLKKCIDNGDENSLDCGKCGRKVHFVCTKLPPYQVHFSSKIKESIFNCVKPPEHLIDLMKTKKDDKLESLQREIAGCNNIIKLNSEKENKLLENIELLKSKVKKLKEKKVAFETVDYLENMISEKITDLGSEIKESILNEVNSAQK